MVSVIFDPSLLVLLVAIAFLSGIGITTVGPGGIFLTISLYSLTSIPPATVAGTAHTAFIATGLLASVAYVYSGEIHATEARAIAIVLSLSSVVGALVGAYVNPFVPRSVFGILLGVISTVVGATIVYREYRRVGMLYQLDVTNRRDQILLGALGFVLGTASGLLGVGGPVLAVPALILIGVPMLLAVAVAQIQSVFIAVFAATGFFLQGSVSFSLAAIVGLPLLAGVVVGWKVAHRVDPVKLKVVSGALLVLVGPYLAL